MTGQTPADRERGKRVRRDLRGEAIFDYWCGHRVLRHQGLSLRRFTQKCDAGEVPGLRWEDFRSDPGSDTVDGEDAGHRTQRDDAGVAGTRTTNPGNADRATRPADVPATGAASGPPSHQELPGSDSF